MKITHYFLGVLGETLRGVFFLVRGALLLFMEARVMVQAIRALGSEEEKGPLISHL